MVFIQKVAIRLPGDENERGISFEEDVNVVHGGNVVGKTSLLKILRSALMGDSSILGSVHFRSAEVKIFSAKEQRTYTCAVEKRGATGREAVSAWRVEPSPPGGEEPLWPHLYLPTSRQYSSQSRFAIFHPRKAPNGEAGEDLLERNTTHSLEALRIEYFHDVSDRESKATSDGSTGVLNSFFSREERLKKKSTSGSPESDHARVCSFLERHGLRDRIVSLSTFENIRRDDAGIRRAIHHIVSAEMKLERLAAERETLGKLAGAMLHGDKEISIGVDGVTFASKDAGRLDWSVLSTGEKNGLMMLFAAVGARGGVLLIDDVEFSLRNDLHCDLINNMRTLNPDGQFILTTHSTGILNSVDESRRLRL